MAIKYTLIDIVMFDYIPFLISVGNYVQGSSGLTGITFTPNSEDRI